MFRWLKTFFAGPRPKIQTFTYYIPAPPPRKSGYREKEFDGLFYEFINKGYEIISLQTQAHTGVNQCGMWVIVTVRALTKEAEALNFDDQLMSKLTENDAADLSAPIEDDNGPSIDLPPATDEDETVEIYQLNQITAAKMHKRS